MFYDLTEFYEFSQREQFSRPLCMKTYTNFCEHLARNSSRAYLNEKHFEQTLQRVTKYISGAVNCILLQVLLISV
jgi:hypothetical protein